MGSSKKANALQKERQAELKKKFFKTLGDLCIQLLGENVLHLLPQNQLEALYLARIRDFKFTFQHNNIVDEGIINKVRKTVNDAYYLFKMPYGSPQYMLTHNQTDIYLSMLGLYIKEITRESFANAALFLEKTQPLLKIILSDAEQVQRMSHTNFITCNYFHIVTQCYLKGNCIIETLPPVGEITPLRYSYHYEWIKATMRKFNIEGRARPAFLLRNTFDQPLLSPLTITPAQLGMNTPFSNIPLEVYIQQHAINRTMERLDVLQPAFIHMVVVSSLLNPQTCLDSHGNHLIVVKYNTIKLGYLRVDLVEGYVLIRTFLLFTQDSTPEGEKIKQLAGFQKEDISYLHLDKISSFINLDFSENSRLKTMLKQCGLGEFVENQKSIKAFVHNNRNLHTSQIVEKYFNTTSPEMVESDCV